MRKIKIISSTVATGLIAAASALGSANAAPAIQSDPKTPLTVWVDGNRSTQAKAYKAAHPEIAITINTVDPSQGSNTSKIALAVKAGSGIPDVVFLGSPDEISTLSANPINYPLALDDLVPKNLLDGFPAGSLDRCTYNGKIYCLGNDTGQTVLWYNKPLFKEWGYSVPNSPPSSSSNRAAVLGIRPEQFIVDSEHGVPAEIIVVEPTGSQTQLVARIAGQDVVGVFRERIALAPGDIIPIMPVPEGTHLFDEITGRAFA